MLRIMHLADLHLDTPFSGLPSDVSQILRQDLLDTFSQSVEYAKKNDINAVLLAGDLFDNSFTKPSTADFLVKTLANAPDIRFFISPGNHDCSLSTSIYLNYPFSQNVHIFKSDKPEFVELPEFNACIYGVGAVSPHSDERVLKDFRVADDTKINIMAAHGSTFDWQGNDIYYPIAFDDIANSGLDYLALGHTHAFSGIKKAGGTFYAYPGCPQGRGFDELGQKGIIAGDIGKGENSLKFVPLSKRCFKIIDVNIDGAGDYSAVKQVLNETLSGLAGGVIARIRLKGAVRDDFIINTALLKEGISAPLYIEFEDKTTATTDVLEIAKDRTLKGLFVKRILEQKENETDEQRKAILDKALRFGLAALDGEEVPLNDN